MYNNNFPFIPDMNPFSRMNELEQSINRLDREVKRLEHRIKKIENENNQPHITTTYENTNNYNFDDDGMYMM